jgi:ribosome-binding factor A
VLTSVLRKCTVIAPVSLSIALLVTSCSDNKASQCQRLIKVVNAGTSLIDKNKGAQVVTSVQLSKDLAYITKSIKELNFKDPKLKEFQSGFVKVFQTLSEAIAKAARGLGVAKTAEASVSGREKIQKARAEIDSALTVAATTVGKQSDALVKDLNKYCNQPE